MRLPSGFSSDPDGSVLRGGRWPTVLLGATVLVGLLLVTPRFHPGLSQIVSAVVSFRLTSAPEAAASRPAPPLAERPTHPAQTLSPYFPPSAAVDSATSPSVLRRFHALLQQYVRRQAQDDNFTVRVLDRRTNQTLEVRELTDLRAAYRRGAAPDWEAVDARRHAAMDRLVDKYEARGVPLEDIIVRWGRANQVRQAHERDRPYQAYERRLAESLGLSLLATEIGTVETFNQDHLVSGAGAQSRYQMLPWVLRRSGVTEYVLPTANGSRVPVREVQHPLLVLEPAFLLLRGYTNAVGHEIPGLSAYHTGPGNVFKLYRHYYATGPLSRSSTVADAYAWAVTKGFDTVSEGSSFGGDSRGYVPALYGALAARDDQPADPSPPLRAVRLQLKPSASVSLRSLLAPLRSPGQSLDWGPAADTTGSVYERFRALNPHVDLPPSPTGAVPAGGNVRLVSSVEGRAVEFFLPLRAPALLRAAGIDALDSTATFRYNASTYAPPSPHQRTRWDRQYAALVDDVAHFGFTQAVRDRLLRLHERFEALAEQRPTRFRRRQLRIISIHRRLWRSGPWEELAAATRRATRGLQIEGHPPSPLPTQTLPLPDSLRPKTPR
jgi:hypothetical protein